jgi:hypothetical protein
LGIFSEHKGGYTLKRFELELDDEYLIPIGKITVNFNTLEQVISFFIWNLIEVDGVYAKLFNDVIGTARSPTMG